MLKQGNWSVKMHEAKLRAFMNYIVILTQKLSSLVVRNLWAVAHYI